MTDTKELDDFYLDERGLASYFECSWLDKFRELGNTTSLTSASGSIPEEFIGSPFFTKVADFVFDNARRYLSSSQDMLEIGPALGRTCYQTLQRFPSIKNVTVVEPSKRLIESFRKLLVEGQLASFPYIHSLRELRRIDVDSRKIADDCGHVEFTLINEPMQSDTVTRQFDLVYCLNVIDQASTPAEIVNAATACTKTTGILVLACSYQWSEKHLQNLEDAVSDINQYFDSSWEKIAETNFDYKFRYNERFSQLFCSHVVMYRKIAGNLAKEAP
ncbi:MAG: hypothetical protein WBJ75_15060 [Pseudohongiellaceae bacterium]